MKPNANAKVVRNICPLCDRWRLIAAGARVCQECEDLGITEEDIAEHVENAGELVVG
jgi:hypothetical protein